MNVMTRARGMEPSDALMRHCVRRMTFALDRFRTVERVGVRLHVASPRTTTCLAIAHVEGRAPIVVRVASSDPYAAVDLAAAKLAESVARAIDRVLRERIVVALRESQRSRRRARTGAS